MGQATLVEMQIDGGKALVESLQNTGFDVTVSGWTKSSEEGDRYLYIASKDVDDRGLTDAYRTVFTQSWRIRNSASTRSRSSWSAVRTRSRRTCLIFEGRSGRSRNAEPSAQARVHERRGNLPLCPVAAGEAGVKWTEPGSNRRPKDFQADQGLPCYAITTL